jgi:hypothetical protein
MAERASEALVSQSIARHRWNVPLWQPLNQVS